MSANYGQRALHCTSEIVYSASGHGSDSPHYRFSFTFINAQAVVYRPAMHRVNATLVSRSVDVND